MYVSEKFVYAELHKTAGTHIGKWLNVLASGEQIGKHNRIPKALRERLFIGSIRNPWDWYVSLWAYGCDGKGSVKHQCCDGINFRYYRQQLTNEMGRSYLSPRILFRQILADAIKPVDAWGQSYSDSTSQENFKAWLKLMFNAERKFDMREGFGFSPLANGMGLLTYRFLKLFTDLDQRLYSASYLSDFSTPVEVWHKHKIADVFIRMENLEDDLIAAMAMADVKISDETKAALLDSRNKKTNISSRLPASHYYDQECVDIVLNRDRLIVDLFGYTPPV